MERERLTAHPLRGNLPSVTEIRSISRALAVLRSVGERPATMVELAERTDLATSTAARILTTLETEGAVRRDAEGVFHIGPTIRSLVGGADARSVPATARPHLERLASELGEAVALTLVDGVTTTTVDQIDTTKPIRAEDWTGTVVPMHAGSVGLVTMAFWSDHEIDRYLQGDLDRCSEMTVTDPTEIRRRIEALRAGHALWTDGEYVEGIASVAAPVLDADATAVAAIYTYGPSFRFPSTDVGPGSPRWIADRVRRAARAVSTDLGHRAADDDVFWSVA